MKTLAPFLISIFFPGIGHLFLRKYWRGVLIFVLSLVTAFYLPVLFFLFVIIALVDLYYIMEKESGRKAASRRLIFSLLLAFIVLPGLFYAFGVSLILSSDYATDHYFNERNTISEMEKITEALASYHLRKGTYPKDYEEFVNTKPIWKNWSSDFWNNPYKYVLIDSNSYELISAGEDQHYGTMDDLVKKSKN